MLAHNIILIQNQRMNTFGKTYITSRAAVLLGPLILHFPSNILNSKLPPLLKLGSVSWSIFKKS